MIRSRQTLFLPVGFLAAIALASLFSVTFAAEGDRVTWKPVTFAIVRYNDDAPKSWNLYHSEKKGNFILRLWKRYLLIDVNNQQAFDLDPSQLKEKAGGIEWTPSQAPTQPLELSEWKSRDVGSMQRVRFRFGQNGNYLELQIPLQPNGKPAY